MPRGEASACPFPRRTGMASVAAFREVRHPSEAETAPFRFRAVASSPEAARVPLAGPSVRLAVEAVIASVRLEGPIPGQEEPLVARSAGHPWPLAALRRGQCLPH